MISPIRPISGDDTTGHFRPSLAYVFTLVVALGTPEPIPERARLYRAVQDSRGGIIFSLLRFSRYALRFRLAFIPAGYHGANINLLIEASTVLALCNITMFPWQTGEVVISE